MRIRITNKKSFENREKLPLCVKQKWISEIISYDKKINNFYLNRDGEYSILGLFLKSQNERFEQLLDSNLFSCDSFTTSISESNKYFKMIGGSGDFNGFRIVINRYEFENIWELNYFIQDKTIFINIIDEYF